MNDLNSLSLSIQEGRYMRDQIGRLNDQIVSLKDQITSLENDLMNERKRLIEVVSENGLLRHTSENLPDGTQIKNLVSHSLNKLSRTDLVAVNMLLERLGYYEKQHKLKDKQWQTMFESYEERLREQVENIQKERAEYKNVLSELNLRVERWENVATESMEENIRFQGQLARAQSKFPAHVPSLPRSNTVPSIRSGREPEYTQSPLQMHNRRQSTRSNGYLGPSTILRHSYRLPFERESPQPKTQLASMTAAQRTQALKAELQEVLDNIYHMTHSKASIDTITSLAQDVKAVERQSLKYLPLKGRTIEEHFEQIERCKKVLEEIYKEAKIARFAYCDMARTQTFKTTPRRFQSQSPSHLTTPVSRKKQSMVFRSLYKQSMNESVSLSLSVVRGVSTSINLQFATHHNTSRVVYAAGCTAIVLDNCSDFEGDQNVRRIQQRFYCPSSSQLANSSNSSTIPTSLNTSPIVRPRSLYGMKDMPSLISPAFLANQSSFFESSSSTADVDETSGKGLQKDRVRNVSSLAISENGNLLAIGEGGTMPRIVIYKLNLAQNEQIPVCLPGHTQGVILLAFSPCNTMLASLGQVDDGYIFLWSVSSGKGSKKLATNKHTIATRAMAWMGKSLVTVGLRSIKVWQVPESNKPGIHHCPMPFENRSVILGPLVDSYFTCVTAISPHMMVICSSIGDICVLGNDKRELKKLAEVNFGIFSVDYDPLKDLVWIAGMEGQIRTLDAKDIRIHASLTIKKVQTHVSPNDSDIAALRCLADGVITTINTDRKILFYNFMNEQLTQVERKDLEISGHKSAVKGVRVLERDEADPLIYTWSNDGTVCLWNSMGECCTSGQYISAHDVTFEEELSVVDIKDQSMALLAGYKSGTLRYFRGGNSEVPVWTTIGHDSEVRDIATGGRIKHVDLLVTSSRLRTVNVWGRTRGYTWQQVQTLSTHSASVHRVLLSPDSSQLVTISSDRSVAVYIANGSPDTDGRPTGHTTFQAYRNIQLQRAAIDATFIPDDPRKILASLSNGQVHIVNVFEGQSDLAFKGDDGAQMTSISASQKDEQSRYLVAGVGSDKSLRIFDVKSGCQLKKEWGHAEGVSGVTWLRRTVKNEDGKQQTSKILITTGYDGCVLFWNFEDNDPIPDKSNGHSVSIRRGRTLAESPSATPLSRKIRKSISTPRLFPRNKLQTPSPTDEAPGQIPPFHGILPFQGTLSPIAVTSPLRSSDESTGTPRSTGRLRKGTLVQSPNIANMDENPVMSPKTLQKNVNGVHIVKEETSITQMRNILNDYRETLARDKPFTAAERVELRGLQSELDQTVKLLKNIIGVPDVDNDPQVMELLERYSESLLKTMEAKMSKMSNGDLNSFNL
ncbi:Mitogen-activated protein kinase-binding protein 1 [Neolecta irregularis DAH-3]|uniref:Mitogen-activated protein kinase-binding protein 1 n=1 Tax=Neolecta irregularis (strain DAH-3) TaxID=1198029 RepID=A0A1U7LNG4_NEOID|nr:Mitogen-activated protein kinase-binding protein 1 [Neolecta irregularis DAH-3]|eukprot:OLL24206.1 Mitogen-activated protein kinase-binding protein 1 [Neolecta irregularis DAH-3]